MTERRRPARERAPTAAASPAPWDDPRAPNAWLMLLEGRAPMEYAAMLAALPWLSRKVPRGDGHGVIVFPGLAANDLTTWPLRAFLASLGYVVRAWGQGLNLGPRKGVLDRAENDLAELARETKGKVSLIGWSLGGIYARELARAMPQHARCVVTLGTPFTGHPKATNAWRVYELVTGTRVGNPALMQQIRKPPPVPTTSIYSRTDGVVAWRCSINEPGPTVENIEVHASHVGMGMNPLALYAIGDRLAQPPGRWQPFDATGVRRFFFRVGVDWPMPAL